MEKYFVVLLLHAVILALSIQSGLSVKCYFCNTKIDDKCGDPADKVNMKATECTRNMFQEAANQVDKGVAAVGKAMNIDLPEGGIGQKFACQKVKITGVDDKGTDFIMRGCTVASSMSGDACSVGIEKLTGGHGKVEFCGTCEDDYCNGSSRQSFTTLLLMLVPCFAAVISHWISI